MILLKKLFRLTKLVLKLSVFRKSKMAFIFGSPYHPNMGDQAQTYCLCYWLKNNYPSFEQIIFRYPSSSTKILKIVRFFIRKNDMIICHSGYHLTNLYPEQKVYFYLIKHFKDHKIVIFPQTINYTTAEALYEAQQVLNSHPNLTILCRDEKSYAFAQQYFTMPKLMLYPDIVTSLIGTRKFTNKRSGILFCMRDDIEAFYKPSQINELKTRFKGVYINQTDTTIHNISIQEIYNDRGKILSEIFEEYSKYEVVITDRYHGTIFSLIAATPVVVIGSTDHKLSSGVKWFPRNIFGDYITFANDLDEAYSKAIQMLQNSKKISHELPPYFKENYYDILKKRLESNSNK